ncbi:hypothetical protein DFQ28_007036 [Apophysomyces sp. BC1034]|nr:hypothetical protein DFQ30_007367 [Apophysomyces sp. BC1015]KAG0178823.1 hypothetical protein DFQ29_002940 [Apophysomyces sp. BC1021]KAG0186982.1 hypothetical protein DFQ28_007036 [Apophysomyces sp. BC1034]
MDHTFIQVSFKEGSPSSTTVSPTRTRTNGSKTSSPTEKEDEKKDEKADKPDEKEDEKEDEKIVAETTHWRDEEVRALIGAIKEFWEPLSSAANNIDRGSVWEEIMAQYQETYPRIRKRSRDAAQHKWRALVNQYNDAVDQAERDDGTDPAQWRYYHTLDSFLNDDTMAGSTKSVEPETRRRSREDHEDENGTKKTKLDQILEVQEKMLLCMETYNEWQTTYLKNQQQQHQEFMEAFNKLIDKL